MRFRIHSSRRDISFPVLFLDGLVPVEAARNGMNSALKYSTILCFIYPAGRRISSPLRSLSHMSLRRNTPTPLLPSNQFNHLSLLPNFHPPSGIRLLQHTLLRPPHFIHANSRSDTHEESESRSRAEHILAERAEVTVRAGASLEDVVATEDEAHSEANAPAHHGAHFHWVMLACALHGGDGSAVYSCRRWICRGHGPRKVVEAC